MIRAIVFDCFGVLWSDALVSVFAHHTQNNLEKHQRLLELGRQADTGRVSNENFWKGLATIMNLDPDSCRQLVETTRHPNTPLFERIKSLKTTYKIGLLSNAGADVWDYITPERKRLFDSCVISAEEGIAKPDPRIFQIICRRLSVKPQEVLFIDDSAANCHAAQTMGMQVVQYRTLRDALYALPPSL